MAFAIAGLVSTLASTARAEATLIALAAQPGQLRVDGSLREWPQRRMQTITEADGGELSVLLAYDDQALFVAARVEDNAVIRTSKAGRRDDAVVVELTLPQQSGRARKTAMWLHPGVPGKQAAVARFLPGGLQKSVEIVEGPPEKGQGYVLEARIPWKLLPGGENRNFARVAVRLHDVDAGGKTKEGGLSSRPLILEGSPVVALSSFLQHQDLVAAKPSLDRMVNVAGDARVERVMVIGTFVAVVPADAPMRFASLPISSSSDVVNASIAPLFGNGQSALLVHTRRNTDQGSMDLLQVYRLDGDPKAVLNVEVRKDVGSGFAEAKYAAKRGKKGNFELVVEPGATKALSASSLRQSPAPGVEGLILPWGPVARSHYAWDGNRFVPTHEPNKKYKPEEPQTVGSTSSSSRGSAEQTQVLIPPTEAALLKALKSSRGMPASLRPSHVERINVAEDTRRESMLILDHDLVVLGEGFRGGTGFFYFTLPAKSSADIRHVFTADMTGDGRREIFVRVIEHIGDVTRHVLHGYSFEGGDFTPILAVEVYRAMGRQVIANRVKVERRGKHYGLRIEPGVIRGWDASNYPFADSAGDTCGPLLLPFRDSVTHYRYSGGQLVAER